ncbi:hypothetical protein AB0C84_46160 [Actinomadura sp. NPDC048955]|uniref:hypothetical protein n=1 Tax=Actinomadura sp. NPDC048955 TaxID=3158228 RepID=UPI0033DDD88A
MAEEQQSPTGGKLPAREVAKRLNDLAVSTTDPTEAADLRDRARGWSVAAKYEGGARQRHSRADTAPEDTASHPESVERGRVV